MIKSVQTNSLTVIDLFSGAGGMSLGFHLHPAFEIVAAFDGEFGKPSSGKGKLGCNETYRSNIPITPTAVDLAHIEDQEIEAIRAEILHGMDLDVLSACPPCTGFSRANPNNHLADDHRNSLVVRTEKWVRILRPNVLVMENARELLRGNFSHHFRELRKSLEFMGYQVHASVHMLNQFGLPQRRERALVIASKLPGGVKSLEDLWSGYRVKEAATTVHRCIASLPNIQAGEKLADDKFHISPSMNEDSIARLKAIPKNGGSWTDLRFQKNGEQLMTPAMKRYVEAEDFGSHPDVYGRMAWDRPAVTIKRECSHIGNGRYAHPEQDRLCSVREMALLQGFPMHFKFGGGSVSNMYRHIGDAVPPLISYQLAHVVHWIFTGKKPEIRDCVLPGTSLLPDDIQNMKHIRTGQLSLLEHQSERFEEQAAEKLVTLG
ncbi:MAG: DNA cytosine methyltransferase [Limnobacter sp.]|uniref:DNA cytosine methyltransferase n=1 Tax=Limnobacter sp. TaxID=2003368 RepID=UPI0022C2E280|nr:DNA cytosine methyltransferase [Limnobacter sp.]MCZ8016227.1 DNA cytosine methyltransferase [Limnobacter sp.]